MFDLRLLDQPTISRRQHARVHRRARAVELDRIHLGVAGDVRVRGALCFVEADLPVFGTLAIDGVAIVHRRGLAKRLNAKGTLSDLGIERLAKVLARELPQA